MLRVVPRSYRTSFSTGNPAVAACTAAVSTNSKNSWRWVGFRLPVKPAPSRNCRDRPTQPLAALLGFFDGGTGAHLLPCFNIHRDVIGVGCAITTSPASASASASITSRLARFVGMSTRSSRNFCIHGRIAGSLRGLLLLHAVSNCTRRSPLSLFAIAPVGARCCSVWAQG